MFGLAALAATGLSCAQLGLPVPGALGGNIQPPALAFQGVTLARAPAAMQLAAYYCPDVVSAPLGSAGMICQGLFGARPDPGAMTVDFDVHFKISNPNQIPLPLSSLLTAVTVFPAASNQRLGAACVSFCGPDNPGCGAGPNPNACQASSRDIHSLSDYAAAAAPLLAVAGLSGSASQVPSLLAPNVAAGTDLDVVARMSLEPAELLAVMRQLAAQAVDELKRGCAPTFVIPYRLEGTVWFDAGAAGRVAVPWGPTEGTFTLPVQGLVPAS
ncbi:MAG TPA: hypothetical protein VLT58_02875 [Polyangia bacterium]|nr:hypothetical protein [Polyangia bacterium]